MIGNANFTLEQEEIIKEACDIELDKLISLKSSTNEIQQYLLDCSVVASIDEIDEVLTEQISNFYELKQKPNSIFQMEKRNQEIVELCIQWYIDKYDGDPTVNRIYSKIFRNQDLSKISNIN